MSRWFPSLIIQYNTIQHNFIAKCQYNDCTRNVLWCQVHSSHIHSNHKTFNYNNSKNKTKKPTVSVDGKQHSTNQQRGTRAGTLPGASLLTRDSIHAPRSARRHALHSVSRSPTLPQGCSLIETVPTLL